MDKLKPLLPSLREKKRYLVFSIISKNRIANKNAVFKAIEDSMRSFIGELGMAEAGMIFIKDKYDSGSQKGIARVNNKYLDKLKASLCFVRKIDAQEAIARSVYASGILKKAGEYVYSKTKSSEQILSFRNKQKTSVIAQNIGSFAI